MSANSPVYPKQKVRFATRVGNWVLSANALLVFGFIYLPVLVLIVFSFNDTRSVAVLTGFSNEWYVKLSQNTELLHAAKNSLLVGIIATIAATSIGTMTAIAMDRYRFKLRTAFDANLYLPIVIPEIVMGISLLLFFNQALFPFLLNTFGIKASTGLHTITISHIAFDIPFVYVIVRARLADFDRSLEEAAADLGADEWQTFKRVTLPLLMPGIIGGALMAFTLSLDDYLITVFTKGVQEQTMPLYIYSLVRRGVTPEINALSTVLLVGSIGLVGMSLTAQNGGPVFTKGMSVGLTVGLGLFGLYSIPSVFTAFTVGNLIVHVLLLLSFVMAWRSLPDFLDELSFTEKSSKILAWFVTAMAGIAAFISALLLI